MYIFLTKEYNTKERMQVHYPPNGKRTSEYCKQTMNREQNTGIQDAAISDRCINSSRNHGLEGFEAVYAVQLLQLTRNSEPCVHVTEYVRTCGN